jgi:sugar/nucleoside kinase (ribokinase family)
MSTSVFDQVVIGEINADLILKGNVVPTFGQVEQLIDHADLTLGSSAIIYACGAARLGLKTAFIGKVGDDLFGRFMLESIQARGIDVSGVIIDPSVGTGLSVILAQDHDRAILTYPGSIPELEFSDIDFSLIEGCRHLHLSGYFLLEKLRPHVAKVFKNAKAHGLSISLDTNYDPEEKWNGDLDQALASVDVFLPNETEAAAISGEDGIGSAMRKLGERIPTVVVKCGREGAQALTKEGDLIEQAAAKVEVVDTVGAGDSFDAGFIYTSGRAQLRRSILY